MLIGVIADDFTGATDVAGFLVSNGVSTTQLIGVPPASLTVDAEAVVISLKSRTCAPEDRITSYNVCYTKLLRISLRSCPAQKPGPAPRITTTRASASASARCWLPT